MNLKLKEHTFYARHLLLDKVGEKGQLKLKQAKVLVIGAGGLGCPILLYLNAAGVGTIGIIDFDVVSMSNLHRQVLYGVADLGKPKVEAAKTKLQTQNPFTHITSYNEALTNQNALALFEQYDIIVDGSDNFSTRYLVNDACVLVNKPLVYGAIYRFEGQVTVFNYADGPTYRCLFPNPPEQIPSCAEAGVLGVLPGVIGNLQAVEVLKIILNIGAVLSGKIQLYNALEASFMTVNLSKNSHLKDFGISSKESFKNFDYQLYCGEKSQEEISKEAFDNLPQDTLVLDVRAIGEKPVITTKNTLQIPFASLAENIAQIPKNKTIYVVCQRGKTSLAAIQLLQEKYQYTNLINLKNGLLGN